MGGSLTHRAAFAAMNQSEPVDTAKIDGTRLRRTPSRATPPPGERLDRYELVRPLGRGGFSTVHEAYDPRIKRSVAIKRCSSLDPENHDRFFREAEIAGNLSHVNIVRIFDFGVVDGVPFIVQELLSGKDLADWIDSGLALSNRERVCILLQIAEGLAYAHSRDVVHRDVKPANVRVLEDGSIKLLDFGVAAIQEAPSTITQAGMTVGTAAYLAPEQLRGERPGKPTDVFAFGVVAYELLSGHRPFEGETLSGVLYQVAHHQPEELRRGSLPEPLLRVVHHCLDKKPERRPVFEEVIERLEAALRDPRLRPPAAETVPIELPAAGLGPVSEPETPKPKPAGSLADVSLDGRARPVRDSSTRIQVARPRRRPVRLLLALVAMVAAVAISAQLVRPAGVPVDRLVSQAESWLDQRFGIWRELLGIRPAPVPGPVGVPSERTSVADTAVSLPSRPPSSPADQDLDLDPVSAAVSVLEANGAAVREAAPAPPVRRRAASRTAATGRASLFLPPGWHPRMTVSVDRGAFRSLTRRQTYELRPGAHEVTFRLDTSSYTAQETLKLDLQANEVRTVRSPLQPPGALRIRVLPETTAGRVEIDGRSLALPLPGQQLMPPGTHELKFHPSPADALGPLTKTATLSPSSVHVVTFDLRRRRASLEVTEPFEWSGE